MSDFNDLQKVPRQMDWDYVTWIKGLPCLVTGRHHPDPHHLSSRGAFGSDYSCVPLKRFLHVEIEKIGIKEFEAKYKCNLWHDAWNLLRKYFTEVKR